MNQPVRPALLLLVFWGVLLAACSPSGYPPKFVAARKAEDSGRLEVARRNYDIVFRSAKKPRDRTEAGMRLGSLLLRMGRRSQAVETYLQVEAGPGRGTSQGARALVRAASVLADRLHEEHRAETIWRRVVRDYPGTLAATDALSRLVSLYGTRFGPRQLLRFLSRLAAATPSSQLKQYAAWKAADICRRDIKDPDCAFRYCVAAWKAAPNSALADDALICAARQARRMGRPRQALVWYRRLLSTREEAVMVGSYHSEWLDDAQFELGKLYLEDLGDQGRAIAAFRTLLRTYPASVLRDDASWWICLTRLRQGRRKEAIHCWKRLVRRFPDSRFVREEKAFQDWSIVASAIAKGKASFVCPALAVHARAHPFGWFRRRRKRLAERFKCPQTR